MTTEAYNGTDYFWAYAYRYPMRDLTPAGRRRVHATMTRRGLKLDDDRESNRRAIVDALNSYDRSRLRRCYGDIKWAWWER